MLMFKDLAALIRAREPEPTIFSILSPQVTSGRRFCCAALAAIPPLAGSSGIRMALLTGSARARGHVALPSDALSAKRYKEVLKEGAWESGERENVVEKKTTAGASRNRDRAATSASGTARSRAPSRPARSRTVGRCDGQHRNFALFFGHEMCMVTAR